MSAATDAIGARHFNGSLFVLAEGKSGPQNWKMGLTIFLFCGILTIEKVCGILSQIWAGRETLVHRAAGRFPAIFLP